MSYYGLPRLPCRLKRADRHNTDTLLNTAQAPSVGADDDLCWDGGMHCDRHRSLGECCHCGKKFEATPSVGPDQGEAK
jgi:hypothetical protein